MKITKVSQMSKLEHTMELDVTQEQLDRYAKGIELVQNVFPDLPAPEREFIISGITPIEWDEMFNGWEADDDEE